MQNPKRDGVLKEGIIRRVGDVASIKVWEDPWILEGDTRRPRFLLGYSHVTLVADLLNPNTRG